MSWKPKYTITNKLLSLIREIGEAIGEIRSYRPSGQTLAQLEYSARELSSHASTSIEGNPLPLTDVRRLLKSNKEHIRDTEREVLNYNKALQTLYAAVKAKTFKLDIATFERVQKQVVDGLKDNPADCGHLRKAPVIIRNPRKPDEIVFIPPDAKDVSKLTKALMDFTNANMGKIDPILLAGLFHRQSVIIHPFMDGNGRTTRLMTTAILGKAGLDFFGIFSFENFYNQSITRYFKEVGLSGDYYELEDGIEFTAWLEYFAEGILDELTRVRKTLPGTATGSHRLEDHHRKILNHLEEHGSITQREYAGITSRSLASRKLDFEKLLALGLIEAKGVGRGTFYVLSHGAC